MLVVFGINCYVGSVWDKLTGRKSKELEFRGRENA